MDLFFEVFCCCIFWRFFVDFLRIIVDSFKFFFPMDFFLMESCYTHKVVETKWSSFFPSLSGSALKVLLGGGVVVGWWGGTNK